ncbi:MAG: cytochrome P450 [Ilumatobacteraceae bacterium]
MAIADASRAQRSDSLPELDIISHDVYERGLPHDAYDRLRREAPVAWVNETDANGHDGQGFWAVTRWTELTQVHKDWRTFSSEVGGTEIEELEPDALVARQTMLETDPPRHTRLRQLVNPQFSKVTVETYASSARRIIDEVIDDARHRRSFDAVEHISRQLPIQLLTGILGVPDDDADRLFHWADRITYNADPDYSAAVVDRVDTDSYRLLPFRSPVSLQVFDYVEQLVHARGDHASGDVISILAAAEVDGVGLTDRERDTFFLLLLIAGNETTRHSLSNALIALAEHPSVLRELRDDPTLIDTAVEEVLRVASPQIHFRRTATIETTLADVPIAPGDKIVTFYPAANFDPDQFAEPHTFDIRRSPNRHVTFGGGGPHLCLGQWMARLEVRIFLEALMERVDSMELDGEVERVRSNFINGIKRLPLTWTPL